MNSPLSYLALGDSYTIGESVALFESYPYQVIQLLRRSGKPAYAPEIIAKTGWSTMELASQLDGMELMPSYDFVSILIGVNNQYRGLPSSRYTLELEELLTRCITLAGNHNHHVFVLSIPDWGLTPYARGRDTANISREIALFNRINKKISKTHIVNYLDVTSGSPENSNDLSYLSGDGLHPSSKAYSRWAKLLGKKMLSLAG
jgi:lysophospholipase L1-like esterase